MKKEKSKTNARAVIGFILILLACPLLCVYYVGVLVGGIGLFLSFISKEEDKAFCDIAVAGIIIGTVVVAFGFTMMVITLVGIRPNMS